ncbi:hypothetical protein EDD86DRAFT_247883 [Gorgonomyces haynaldii]|nr:hypothetical protein EDD86DRAFT_247883 [Gorgonomyces haynaldii]
MQTFVKACRLGQLDNCKRYWTNDPQTLVAGLLQSIEHNHIDIALLLSDKVTVNHAQVLQLLIQHQSDDNVLEWTRVFATIAQHAPIQPRDLIRVDFSMVDVKYFSAWLSVFVQKYPDQVFELSVRWAQANEQCIGFEFIVDLIPLLDLNQCLAQVCLYCHSTEIPLALDRAQVDQETVRSVLAAFIELAAHYLDYEFDIEDSLLVFLHHPKVNNEI